MSREDAPRADQHALTVLTVNDESLHPDMHSAPLREAGYPSLSARDGREGLDAHGELGKEIEERTAELSRVNASLRRQVEEIGHKEASLRESEERLRKAHNDNQRLLAAIPSIMIAIDGDGRITQVNRAAEITLGISQDEVIGRPIDHCGINWDSQRLLHILSDSLAQVPRESLPDLTFTRPDGREGVLGITINPFEAKEVSQFGLLLFGADITERRNLEAQLRQAQKLESIGQLAAGIAHEINTPTQYVGDNTRFLDDAFGDISTVLTRYAGLFEAAKGGAVPGELLAGVEEAVSSADIEYLLEEVPRAVRQALEGVEHITRIVKSMKDFAHPGSAERRLVDLNRAIESTVTVARNEWKYVAEMEMDFDPALPPVPCYLSELNQALINIVINAAHAVADKSGDGSHGKGTIRIGTRREGGSVVIRISDTGTGIPEGARAKIFDPFFTTKEVGKGTGQGLAISHTVVVERHGGQLSFETQEGVGTTFVVRLPLKHDAGEMLQAEGVLV